MDYNDYKEEIKKIIEQDNLTKIHKEINKYDKKLQKDEIEHISFFGQLVKCLVETKSNCEKIMASLMGWSGIEDIDIIIIKISTDFTCNRDDLKYIVNCVDTSNVYDILQKLLMKQDIDCIFSIASENIIYAYDKILTESFIKRLLDQAIYYDKLKAVDYLRRKQKNFPNYAKKPDWLSKRDGESNVHLTNTPVGVSQQLKDTTLEDFFAEAENIIEGLYIKNETNLDGDLTPNYDQENEQIIPSNTINVKDVLKTFLSTTAQNEVYKKDKMFDYEKMHRVWGPINSIIGKDCFYNPGNTGPCRMLVCNCKENDEEPWFKKECDNCLLKIKDPSHCIRYPLKEGGWGGCFCSFICMIRSPPEEIDNSDMIKLTLLEEELLNTGIMDRDI